MERINSITELYKLYMSPSVLKDKRLSTVDRFLLVIIAAFDQSGKGCWLSNAQLGDFINCSPGTVSKSVNKLFGLKYIIVNKQSTINGGRSYMRKVAPCVKRD